MHNFIYLHANANSSPYKGHCIRLQGTVHPLISGRIVLYKQTN